MGRSAAAGAGAYGRQALTISGRQLSRALRSRAAAGPGGQVWVPKSTVAGKPFWLSADAAPFIMSDASLQEFRDKRCVLPPCAKVVVEGAGTT